MLASKNSELKTQNSKIFQGMWPWGWLLAVAVALLATFAPPLIAIGLAGGLLVAMVLVRKPVWGAYALVLSVPVQKAVSYDAGPIEITVTQTLFVFVLSVWWAWMAIRSDRRLVMTPITVTMIFYFVAMLMSLFVATSLPASLAELSRWAVTILAYVVILNSIQTRREMNWLIVAMFISALFEAVLGLVQAYTGVGPASFNVGGLLTRAYGTIGAPNSFAGYIDMTLPLAISLAVYFWARWGSLRRAAPYPERPSYVSLKYLRAPVGMTFIALILFWTVLTTLSRGAWIGLSFGVLAMVLALGKRAAAAISVLFGGLLLLGVAGVAGLLPPTVTDRFGLLLSQLTIFDPRGVVPTPENYAVVERMVHWFTAGNMFLSSPIFGVGIGNFNTLFVKFGVQGWPYSAGHAHNYYLHALAETGVVGTTFYVVVLIAAVTVAIRGLRRVRAAGDTYGEAVVIGALGILVTFMAHNFFEDLHV